ncbi:MAG: hypothetical protein M0Z95_26850 [Actinomycetota bacterium]|nr:hypothetical protein [Actinomycetota bacterium]
MPVLALDGGNTKSVAVVATSEGDILGSAAVDGCGDIYGAVSEDAALTVLSEVAHQAMQSAGVRAGHIALMTASLAGADWPEDFALYRRELRRRVGLSKEVHVMNDGLGPLRLGNSSGTGVAVVAGTGAAVGARGPDGQTWHASFWLRLSAPGSLGRLGLEAVYQAALGLGPPTALTSRLLSQYREPDVEKLLHACTRRDNALSGDALKGAARVVLDADGAGDEVAGSIVDSYAAELAGYAAVAASKVDMTGSFPVVLLGGLLDHQTSRLPSVLAKHVREREHRAEPVFPKVVPVAGVVLEAIALRSGTLTEQVRSRVLASPEMRTLGRRQEADGP